MKGYVPYTGPGGPTAAQIDGNNQALITQLRRKGIACTYNDESKRFKTAAPDMVVRAGKFFVCYDRWGFVVQTVRGRLLGDQVNLSEAVRLCCEVRCSLKTGEID